MRGTEGSFRTRSFGDLQVILYIIKNSNAESQQIFSEIIFLSFTNILPKMLLCFETLQKFSFGYNMQDFKHASSISSML